MSDYKPGTVAVATVRGVKDVRIFRYEDFHGHERWDASRPVDGVVVVPDKEITDIRPLVVLDLDEIAGHLHPVDRVKYVLKALRSANPATDFISNKNLANAIEAQTKPLPITEPTLYGVVEASSESNSSRRKWVHYGTGWRDAFGYHVDWDDLLDPVLVREGVQ